MTLSSFRKLKPHVLLGGTIFIYIVFFSILSLWKLNNFYYDNLDLAIFNQVFFNTLNGNFFAATIHPPTYLIDHFTPIIFLLIPFYAINPGPQMLLILQTIIIGLTAIPIYLIAKHVIGIEKQWLILFAPLLWLANPMVHNMNFFEFHVLPFAVFLIFWALHAYLIKNKGQFIVLIILALLVREDVGLIIMFLSAIAFIHKRSWFWKLYPALISTVYTLIAFAIIQFNSPSGSYKFASYIYGWLGGNSLFSITASFITHPIELLTHQLTVGNFEFILGLTFPFFFVVFALSEYLLLLVAPLAQIWLSANGGSSVILMIHTVGFLLIGLFRSMIGPRCSMMSKFESIS